MWRRIRYSKAVCCGPCCRCRNKNAVVIGPCVNVLGIRQESPMRLIQRVALSALALVCISCQSAPPAKPVPKQVKLDASNIAEAQVAGYKVIDDHGNQPSGRKGLETGSRVRFRTSRLTAQEWLDLS